MQVARKLYLGTHFNYVFYRHLLTRMPQLAIRLTIAILSPKNQQKYIHW